MMEECVKCKEETIWLRKAVGVGVWGNEDAHHSIKIAFVIHLSSYELNNTNAYSSNAIREMVSFLFHFSRNDSS